MLKEAKDIGECEKQVEILSQIVEYSKANFYDFFPKYKVQISKLMTSVAFINELEDTKYYDLTTEIHWNHLTQNFVRDFCKLQGSGRDSGLTQQGLFMCLKVGTLGIPKFQKYFKAFKSRQHLFLNDELQIDFDLDSSHKFHSIFICPVSKEIATKENPPMLLRCGHCITKLSFENICGTGRGRSRAKCPTCPAEVRRGDAKELNIF